MEAVAVGLIGLGAGIALAVMHSRATRGPLQGAPNEAVASIQEDVKRLHERLTADTQLLSMRLEGIDSRMTQTQTAGADLARDIFGVLGDVRRATHTVAQQAREFTGLQDLLKAPKARGGLGEAMLEELLRQILPPRSY